MRLEKELKIELGKELQKLGCKIFLDEKIDGFGVFHKIPGSETNFKIDMLIFNDRLTLTQPIGIELKVGNKFAPIANGIKLQLEKKYVGMGWTLEDGVTTVYPTIIGIATSGSVREGFVYKNEKRKVDGFSVNFVIERFLWKSDMCLLKRNEDGQLVLNYKDRQYSLSSGISWPATPFWVD